MTTFTHLRTLDPAWRPGPGQRYAAAPKARMRVTRITAHTVYYRYADDTGTGARFSMPRATWDRDYAPTTESETTVTNPRTYTDMELETALRAWSKDAYDADAVVDIILNTHLRDEVVPKYLKWLEPGKMARPLLTDLLTDEAQGKIPELGSTAHFLAQFAWGLWRGPIEGVPELDMRGVWKLSPQNRKVLLDAMHKALRVER